MRPTQSCDSFFEMPFDSSIAILYSFPHSILSVRNPGSDVMFAVDVFFSVQIAVLTQQKVSLFGSFYQGETAEMPGMYRDGEYDLAGFAVGAVERSSILPLKDSIVPGDVVIGLASSGLHSNGFSLVRKVIEICSLGYHSPCPFDQSGKSLGEMLLTPTKIYVESVLPVLKSGRVKAFVHVTGIVIIVCHCFF